MTKTVVVEVASNEDGGNWHHAVRLRGKDKSLNIRLFSDRTARDRFADQLADMLQTQVVEIPWFAPMANI